MKKIWILGGAALGLTLLAGSADAHFRLLAPASWVEENNLGNPQKAGPCGLATAADGKLTNAITNVKGGASLHIQVQETVYHPGHYRVALAVNSPSELPVDPKATTMTNERGMVMSVSGEVGPAKAPVLVDGLWPHQVKVTDSWEADVTIPNINCKACTLQVIQFMEQHPINNPGEFTYHHCAVLHVTADPAKPLDNGWPKERN